MENKSTTKSEAALREEKILKFWEENKIFEKSLEKKEKKLWPFSKSKAWPVGLRPREFIFYEGPPTANAKPALHHLEARAFKDAIPRYKTMRGFHVRRKAGWDTHGLPVELQVEKKLGLNSKKAIEEYGIAKFNRDCKESVWEYLEVWNKFTKRIGYWVDQENPYVTYDNSYIESVWNVVKVADEKKLLYKDYKVVPWCPRCGTALSSHELAQGYEDVKDLSVYVKFRLKAAPSKVEGKSPSTSSGHASTYVLAWTTTPWTLPGNVALAVGENIDYVKAKVSAKGGSASGGGEYYILAKARLSILENVESVEEVKAEDLIGLEYEPLFPYLKNQNPKGIENAYKVYAADFVNTEDGTGIVHTAVMYGQDDFVLGTKVGLPKYHLVNPEGKFVKGTDFLEGRFVKEKNEEGKPTLDVDIIKYLTERNLFLAKENYAHSYPHCWRCKTPLIYYARDSWYIKMSEKKVKESLINENKKINWEPEYIREGRFGEWLREIKDWAISRERYWGTPLPVWGCGNCKTRSVIGSLDELKKKTKKSGNKYLVMRHGEAIDNAKHIYDPKGDPNNHLTDRGKKEAQGSAKKLKGEKIDLIFTSPFIRTRETATIISKELGLEVKIEERLHEHNESNFKDVRRRMGDFILELETKFEDKKILIISHGSPIWILEQISQWHNGNNFDEHEMLNTAEVREINFVNYPHNNDYELDLHRPYIDEVKLVCAHSTSSGQACGGEMTRTREVMDVWLDSGCMPFAQDHYPFQNKKWVEGKGYPADFISEAIDQTRGWFYTLHAVGVIMGWGRAFKNVICLGHLLDANGKKMSKSVGNIVDPWEMTDKYGVDTLRLWMYSVNQPGESKNFDEKTVALLQQQVFGLLYNVLAFYELYRDPSLQPTNYNLKPSSVLDQWIMTRLNELIKLSTESLDNYKLLEPVRATRDFIGDLSTWYLRRSRERIKNGDENAKRTLYFVLKTLAQIMAPFTPFAAEDVWVRLKNRLDEESVHLSEWPSFAKASKGKTRVLENMKLVREIVSQGLEARQRAKIQVRQPLNRLEVVGHRLESQYLDLIKEELNVKEITFGEEFKLDTEITPALRAEGEYREFMRELQDMRKKMGLKPGDKMPLPVKSLYKKYKVMPSLQMHMLRVAAVASLICDNYTEAVDKDEVIAACLVHDMGNIIKFKMDVLPEFFQPEGPEYWQKVQSEYREKYGLNEHEANIEIARELGLSANVVSIVDSIDFLRWCEHSSSNNFNNKIAIYSDSRVGPYGILSFEERMEDGKKRYINHKSTFGAVGEEERKKLMACGKEIEKQIFAKCKIKPEDITDEKVAPIIEKLKDFVIK